MCYGDYSQAVMFIAGSVYFTISFLVIVIVFGQNDGTLVVFAVFDVRDIV